MTTAYTSLLGLALPVTGELTGTWGDTVNDSITSLLDTAIAGSKTADVTSSDWTLTAIDGSDSGTARAAVLIPTGTNGATTRSILAPNQSKVYVVINQATGSVVVKGVTGPTTGVTIAAGKTTIVAWDGSDFVEIVPTLSTTTNGINSATTTVVVNSATAPTIGQVLTATSGTAATWQTPSASGVTSVTATSPVASTGGTTPVISMPAATTSVSGYLTSTDWNTFNGKLSTTGGTMTGDITFNTGQPLGAPSSGTLSSCTVDGTDAIGFRNIPINSQSTAYTAVLADSGKCIFHPSTDANARTFTIPANSSVAYPIGTAISFVNMTSQVVSIAITTDTMYLAGTGTTGTRSLAQYGTATALKITSTTWIISGAGLT